MKALPTILTRTKTRLRVKEHALPAGVSPILGTGIDVMTLPEGHLSCIVCHGYKFEASLMGDAHRVELGCVECSSPYRLLFPLDVIMPAARGRFVCHRHPKKAMIIIHNSGYLSVGCESCYTEIDFQLRKAEGLVIADA